MPDFEETVDPANVDVLDEAFLNNWEASLGAEEMPCFIEDLIGEFHTTYATKLTEIRECCAAASAPDLIPLVHYVKGSLGNLGLARASAFARQAEFELRTERFSRYDTFAQSLDKHIAEGLRELEARYR